LYVALKELNVVKISETFNLKFYAVCSSARYKTLTVCGHACMRVYRGFRNLNISVISIKYLRKTYLNIVRSLTLITLIK
jgi:hypothetical protein